MCREEREIYTVPARGWSAIFLDVGDTIKVVNTYGGQVVDTWAFNAEDIHEHMSMEHSRVSIMKLIPGVGDVLVTNKRRPILSFVEDTTSGEHDTLVAACDCYRYEHLSGSLDHDNCTANLASALASLGQPARSTPSPLNLFMSVPVGEGGALLFVASPTKAGQYVSLRAEMRSLIVMSACPQDITAVNAHEPCDVHYMVI
ncbi:urea carboxylase-associated family protein [Novosphingobium sp. H3SJ31-1]|uniref:Urea carboxylase-associated family protein n=1 Tax=Novosphingobium album (ex Liu et al. 2023) TaxID=3031130 RepID=A0ABT5WY04_9SPHN|nr:urea carboxylase-associated family protein [Novosphingobium album (ex Liu et al. 2023)]MDE8654608.1 urea carboxylase-associated family protein [Novosphingobium album (ex Liu et al. 2023)]